MEQEEGKQLSLSHSKTGKSPSNYLIALNPALFRAPKKLGLLADLRQALQNSTRGIDSAIFHGVTDRSSARGIDSRVTDGSSAAQPIHAVKAANSCSQPPVN